MRIALVCPYSLHVPGGVQGQVLGLAAALRARGDEVLVVAPGPRPRRESFGPVVAVGRAIAVPANGSRAPVAPGLITMHLASSAVGRFHPDVIHVHEPLVPGPALAMLLRDRGPVIGTFHRAGAGWAYRSLRYYVRFAMNRLSDAVAVSIAARDTLEEVVGTALDVTIVPNAIDVERFSQAVRRPTSRPTLIFVGRHETRKGLDVLLAAFELVSADIDLWVVGDGPARAELETRYGSDKRIAFLGRVDDEELAIRVRSADGLVAPSLGGESFGVVLLEALAARTLVIASDLAGYRIGAGEHAWYFPAGDREALRVLLQRFADRDWDRGQLEGGFHHAQSHGFADLASCYRARYEQVLEGKDLNPRSQRPRRFRGSGASLLHSSTDAKRE